MLDLHFQGGFLYMSSLTALFLIDLAVAFTVLLATIRKKKIQTFWLELVKQIGGFALVWGVLSTVIGLYAAFDDLSRMNEPLPFFVIMGGLKVALITAAYGLIIFLISLAAYLGLRVMNRELVQGNS